MAKSRRGLASADHATRQRVSGEGGKVRAERMKQENEERANSEDRSMFDKILGR